MTSKHTPGPWVIKGYRIYGPIDPRSKHTNGRMLIGGCVDNVNDWCCTPSETRDDRDKFAAETTANLALIARAPALAAENEHLLAENERLRAALEQIHAGELMRGRETWTLADVIQEHYRIARAALAL
jgi:hypothetical protein